MDNSTTAPVLVVFETTKGEMLLEVHPEWSPLGAAHFLELVEAGYYDGAPWFRVIDRFVAQCGIAADPTLNEEWGEKTIQDEPVVKGNQPGFIAFGKTSAPNSRSTHIFINLVDNSSRLDTYGFAGFARVTKGMDVAQKLSRCEFDDQYGLMQEGGLDKFKRHLSRRGLHHQGLCERGLAAGALIFPSAFFTSAGMSIVRSASSTPALGERFHLARRGAGVAADDRPGVAHALARRRRAAADEAHHGLAHLGDELRRQLLIAAADLADHHDALRLRDRRRSRSAGR